MKSLASSLILLAALSGAADAKTIVLKGPAADDFIAKYLPDADIPGPVKATVKCNVPAMGARSNGDVSTCAITLD